MIDNFVEVDKEAARRKVVDLGNNKIITERTDPFGFWKIHFEKGRMPEMLQGQYTSYEAAQRDIDVYLRDKDKVPLKNKE